MSALSRPVGILTVARQFAVAVALCSAVAVPAALIAGSDASTSTTSTESPEDNVWPVPPKPVVPVN